MSFLDAVDVYFTGEKNTAIAVAVLGVFLIGAGVYTWRVVGGGLGSGMGISLLVVGVLASAGGAGLYLTVHNRGNDLAEASETDAAAPIAAERERMASVNANWSTLKIAWTVLIVVALVVLFTVKRDAIIGVTLTVLMLASLLMILDTFAERRALTYDENLERLSAEP